MPAVAFVRAPLVAPAVDFVAAAFQAGAFAFSFESSGEALNSFERFVEGLRCHARAE
ncbi:MAG: hypothetical protein WB949_09175 [Candidatus Acidiferrales bacterium]